MSEQVTTVGCLLALVMRGERMGKLRALALVDWWYG